MSTTQTSEFEAMREFADNLWRQDFQYRIRDMLNHAINGYKAEVVSNPGGGKLEVRFPFEDSTHTFQCSAIMQGASAGSQVLVECLGGLSNAFIRSYARVDRGGGGGGGGEVPTPTAADNGKFLRVVDGFAAWVALETMTGGSY